MIPVFIVSGYLGAGKTTLIRDFLRAPDGLRATVLVNDFGQINIDAELIAETGADTIALTNGCACCSIGDDLLGAAQTAVQGKPDVLIIEASGVAQPARIARLLHGVVGTRPARCLAVVNLARAPVLSRDKFVSTLFRQQIEQAQGLSLNRQNHGLPNRDEPWHTQIARYETLNDFISARPSGDSRQDGGTDTPGKIHFTQSVLHPHAMSEPELKAWLMQRCPNLHRAKGQVPLHLGNGKIYMARMDFVQGDWSFRPQPERPLAHFGEVVAIAPDVR